MVLLVDNSNIINISYAVFVKTMHDKEGPDYVIKESDLGMFWHLYMHKIKGYLSTYKNIIFCGEGHGSTVWRKNKYPLYKENRKERGENPDYDYIITCYKQVEDFLKYFHCCVMRTDYCEADDEIYALCKYFTEKGEEVQVVSSDKDLVQLLNFFDGVSVFNPIKFPGKSQFREPDENIILEKVIVGDASDNIKGIPRCGKKTFEKMLTDKDLWNKKMTPENQKLYEDILDIVDLRRYPEEYHKAVIDNFEKQGYNEFQPEMVEKFYFDHDLRQCHKEWPDLQSDIYMNLKMSEEDMQKSCEDEILDILNS